ERLAKTIFDTAQAKQVEADGLAARQQFASANQAYQDAADRYTEAGLQAQRVREVRVEADKAKARMLAEKERANQGTPEFAAALAEERQANSLYDRLSFRDAVEKFRAAESLFAKTATRRDRRPAAPPTTF